tara:strand:+ start:13193 stop:14698 length:1506 start_codon:yes stop_codon:yes gene_type:complete
MKYIKGHLQQQIGKWKNKQWYRQRFDGCPYFLHMIAEAEIAYHKDRKKNGAFTVHYSYFQNGRGDWYIAMGDIEQVTKYVIDQSKGKSDISKEYLKLWKKDEKAFYDYCYSIDGIDIPGLSDDALMELHNDFMEITLKRFSSSSLIDGFALGTDELIANQIQKVYDKSDLKNTLKFTEVFSTLTAPVDISFINEAEVELLKVGVKIKDLDSEEATLLLEKHQKNNYWILNNYVRSTVLDVAYFKKELKAIFESKIDIHQEIKKIEETPQENKKKKQKLMKKLSLDEDLKKLIVISEDFTKWQDDRKRATYWATHYFSIILAEIAKRVGITLGEIKFMSCREVSKLFEEKPDQKELQARIKNCMYFWDTAGLEAVSGKEAEKVKEEILGSLDLSDVDDFRGLTASPGKATGTVKVLKSATEIDKIEKGDVLVAVMTRPDYIPAMKKAAAIVTDEGGVTCHAAIVSRELGIPCVIATKIATQALKDGMQVEVNADHGIVNIKR